MRSLTERDRQPELMDQPGLDGDAHRHALRGLGTANSVSRVTRAIWRGLAEANLLTGRGRPLRILDMAAGGGDVIIGLARLAARHQTPVETHGCDINPTAVEYAQNAAEKAGFSGTSFFCLNALTDRLPDDYDVLMCTLFLHHLLESDARELLRRMAAATRRGLLVDDLQRSRRGYFYAWAGARLLTRSHVVHVDGPLSVRSAFTLDEMRRLADEAGLSGARFRCHWPARFLMSWMKT